jgi:hypothetical protein
LLDVIVALAHAPCAYEFKYIDFEVVLHVNIINYEYNWSLPICRLEKITSLAIVKLLNSFFDAFNGNKGTHGNLKELELLFSLHPFKVGVNHQRFSTSRGAHKSQVFVVEDVIFVSHASVKEDIHHEKALRCLNGREEELARVRVILDLKLEVNILLNQFPL